jgi:nifR3 family TIM-barrel protein
LKIGPIELDMPFKQAALSGYSDRSMRLLARRYGCPYAINEVVLDKLVLQSGRKKRLITDIGADEHPVGGQIMGSEPERFAAAAAELTDAGYDVIDINFGCPVKKVLGRCRGGFLLSTPDVAIDIVRRAFDAVGGRVPVTVKMRRGMDDEKRSERDFFTILDAAFDIGVAAVTVHGRTVRQRYIGPSRWEFLRRVKRHVGDRVIFGSGDLFTAADGVRMLEETGVDGLSLARGAIGNPWIFRELRAMLRGQPQPPPPTIAEQREGLLAHFELIGDLVGPAKASVVFRKFGVRYSELHSCHAEVKRAFIDVKSPADWHAVIERWYAPDGDYPPVTRRTRPEALVAAGATLECG